MGVVGIGFQRVETLTLTIIGRKEGCQPSVAIEIVVNGEQREAAAGQTVLGLLQELQLASRKALEDLAQVHGALSEMRFQLDRLRD